MPPPMKLISLGLSLWLLVDSFGGLYPLAKDCVGGMKHLPLLVSTVVTMYYIQSKSGRSYCLVLGLQLKNLM